MSVATRRCPRCEIVKRECVVVDECWRAEVGRLREAGDKLADLLEEADISNAAHELASREALAGWRAASKLD